MNKTIKTSFIILLIVVIIAIAWWYKAFAPTVPKVSEENNPNIIKAVYLCANNEQVRVSYDNTDKNSSKAIFSSKTISKRTMPQVISGSGARYSDGVYVWWSKGDTGFLMEATGSEKMIITDCIVKK